MCTSEFCASSLGYSLIYVPVLSSLYLCSVFIAGAIEYIKQRQGHPGRSVAAPHCLDLDSITLFIVEPSSWDSATWWKKYVTTRFRHKIHTSLRIEAQVVAQQPVAENQTELEEALAGDISGIIDVYWCHMHFFGSPLAFANEDCRQHVDKRRYSDCVIWKKRNKLVRTSMKLSRPGWRIFNVIGLFWTNFLPLWTRNAIRFGNLYFETTPQH